MPLPVFIGPIIVYPCQSLTNSLTNWWPCWNQVEAWPRFLKFIEWISIREGLLKRCQKIWTWPFPLSFGQNPKEQQFSVQGHPSLSWYMDLSKLLHVLLVDCRVLLAICQTKQKLKFDQKFLRLQSLRCERGCTSLKERLYDLWIVDLGSSQRLGPQCLWQCFQLNMVITTELKCPPKLGVMRSFAKMTLHLSWTLLRPTAGSPRCKS